MKKTLLLLSIISFSSIITAQVKVNQNAANSAINTSSAFMDASSSPLWNGTTNQGKGMLYPRVDLVNYTAMSHAGPFNASNNPNYFDGLLVFNTATGIAGIGADSVYPGYYYYRNTTTTANGGHWVSLKGIKGDDGTVGPIGPQGVQGIAGNDGLIGASGAQGPTGVAGANGSNGSTGATGAVGPTGASASSASGTRIGFSGSTSWTCPAGITNITVELWGAGGGGGAGSIIFGQYCGGCTGGKGGYNKSTLSVIPGSNYLITIGNGGIGGSFSPYNDGALGGTTNFNSIFSANGGAGGRKGNTSDFPYCTSVANGSVINYTYPILPETRSYIGAGYLQQPGPAANGGGGASAGSGSPGGTGENGFCVISY
jgi:hypothetical protein